MEKIKACARLLLVAAALAAIYGGFKSLIYVGILTAVGSMAILIVLRRKKPIGAVRPRTLCRRKNDELCFKMDEKFWVKVVWHSTGDPMVGITERLFRVSSFIAFDNQDEIVTVIKRFDDQSDHFLRIDRDYSWA